MNMIGTATIGGGMCGMAPAPIAMRPASRRIALQRLDIVDHPRAHCRVRHAPLAAPMFSCM